MKKLLTSVLVLLGIGLFHSPVFSQSSAREFFETKQYFDLRDELANHPIDKTATTVFFRGVVFNRFNQNTKAIEHFRRYIRSGDLEFIQLAYHDLADSYAKSHQYRKAAETFKQLLERFKEKLTAAEAADYRNSFGLWDALKKVPSQKVVIKRDVRVQGTRDKAGLLNLPVAINGQAMDFVFDTGANISVVTVSTAKKLGLKTIETSVVVGSSTGAEVNAKLAVADVVIGDATVHNAVFLVFEDKAVYFPQIDYQIEGILGLPLIEGLENFTINRKDEFFFSANSKSEAAEQNLCLDGLLPLVAGYYKDRRMIFSFDSGAESSMFYSPFFKADEGNITKTAVAKKITVGGAGGSRDLDGYVLDLNLNIANKKVVFPKASVFTVTLNDKSRYLYGNLGQDLIKQFDRMSIDFKTMRLIFE